ncbi:MAG TPA: hypothetical protein VJV79_06265 [Polyangiaceae bacterium]|nr:hypothetical protein [Polyangiaceae bacterium]
MKAWRKIVEVVERVAQGSLELQEFTALFPLRGDATASRRKKISAHLDCLNEKQPYKGLPGIHAARWILLHSPGDSSFPGPLLCSFVFDGEVDDVLFATIEKLGAELDLLLAHCVDAPASKDAVSFVSYLKRHRVESGYFFSDHRTRTLTEITEALQVKEAFETFFAENQTKSTPVIRQNFARFREGLSGAPAVGQVNRLSRPFERRGDQEEAWTRRATELTLRLQQRDARTARRSVPSARSLRVAHAKHHGCVRARFVVRPDLDARYQQGIFVPGNEFEALLRFSNTSNRVQRDRDPDGRGVAIKLLNVDPVGAALVPGIPDGLPNAGTTQDFLMMSSPNFFAKNIRDFTIFRSILNIGSPLQRAPRLAAFFLSRPRELSVLARTFLRPVSHPLNVVYHSVTASLHGPNLAVKYSLRVKPGQNLPKETPDRGDPNFLRAALQRTLHPSSGRPVELEFSIHVPGDRPLSVEDSSLNWDRLGAIRIPVATITIEPQDFSSHAALEQCESYVFSPWHAIAPHKPLGSLNRARLTIYRASSMGRAVAAAVQPAPSMDARPLRLTPLPPPASRDISPSESPPNSDTGPAFRIFPSSNEQPEAE